MRKMTAPLSAPTPHAPHRLRWWPAGLILTLATTAITIVRWRDDLAFQQRNLTTTGIVLGAVALGARAVEKHFTDDTLRSGPDHSFSLDPLMWRRMVDETRILERTLGTGKKKVEENEREARIVQRRSLRFISDFGVGHIINKEDLVALRPAPSDSLSPFEIDKVIGQRISQNVSKHQVFTWDLI